jgi:hypothetical protein
MTRGRLVGSEQEFTASDVTIVGEHLPTDAIQATPYPETDHTCRRLLDHQVALFALALPS